MTQLRQKMLEELQSDVTIPIVPQKPTFASSATLRRISTAHRTSWGRNRSAKTRRICFKAKSCRRLASASMYQHCASCMSKLYAGIF
jgi:hypothetical protein